MKTYERLVDFARRHNIVVVNDNPYSFIINEHPISLLQVPGAKDCCIEFNSMSKSHNMPGWRVGLCASNAQFISWILKVKSNIDSGTFRGIQLAAAEAYDNSDEWHREANINTYRRRRVIAEEIMTVLGCQYDPEQVGMFLWGKIPEHYADAEQLTERVLHEAPLRQGREDEAGTRKSKSDERLAKTRYHEMTMTMTITITKTKTKTITTTK